MLSGARVGFAALTVALGLLTSPPFASAEPERPHTGQLAESRVAVPQSVERRYPILVEIPQIDIAATVTPVGITSNGVMEVPSNIRRIGWYFPTSPAAPELGTTVLVGHRDGKKDPNGVFRNLDELPRNSKIRIIDNRGSVRYFETQSVSIISDAAFTRQASQIFAHTSTPRLVLLTCGGTYDARNGGYQSTVTLIATLATTDSHE